MFLVFLSFQENQENKWSLSQFRGNLRKETILRYLPLIPDFFFSKNHRTLELEVASKKLANIALARYGILSTNTYSLIS